MTDEIMTLRTLLEKSSDADLLREMIGFTAQRLMALEVEGLTGAADGERNPERMNQRNGYRDRTWETRAGTVELRIRQLLSRLPGAAPPGREGARGGRAGGLCARRVDALGRRSRQSDGHDRHLQEPSQPVVRRD